MQEKENRGKFNGNDFDLRLFSFEMCFVFEREKIEFVENSLKVVEIDLFHVTMVWFCVRRRVWLNLVGSQQSYLFLR